MLMYNKYIKYTKWSFQRARRGCFFLVLKILRRKWAHFFMENNHMNLKKHKKDRNRLYLPQMRYVAATDWMDKMGHDAYCLWFKLITMADRSDPDREYDKIPQAISHLAERVGMSRPTFMKYIKILWNYGFIDLEEYTESKKLGIKPVNVIVYDCPRGMDELLFQPLEKFRDYDKDYNSKAKKCAPKRKPKQERKKTAKKRKKYAKTLLRVNVKLFLQSNVREILQSNVREILHNNVLNPSINVLNPINNYLSIKDRGFNETVEYMLVKNQDRLTDDSLNQLKTIYDSYAAIDMNRFIMKLAATLSAVKDNSKIPAYLQKSLSNPDKPGNQGETAAVRVEEMPEGLKNSPQGEELTPEQLAEAEKIREKYRKARAAQ